MPKHRQEFEGEDGWSRWVTPIMTGYRFSCCDCGLVHDMDFQALRVTKRLPNGSWEAKGLDVDKFRVHFRARRNNRATGQVRRHLRLKKA